MIQYIAEKKTDRLNTLLTKVISALGFIIIPISCYCALFSKELVAVAFQRGAFDAAATELTAGVFMGYCIGMLFVGVSTVVTNVFYGFGDTKTTMYISIIEIVINVGLDFMLIRFWGIMGLAIATSVAAIICLCIRFCFLRKFLKVHYRVILIENLKIIGLSLISCVLPFVALRYFFHLNAYLTLIISVSAAVGLYFVLSYACRIDTLQFIKDLIIKRFGKKKLTEEENSNDDYRLR
jgi:putative peptidoglycan lipid II flippase